MPHENDPEDLAPNFHGSYKESFGEEDEDFPTDHLSFGTWRTSGAGDLRSDRMPDIHGNFSQSEESGGNRSNEGIVMAEETSSGTRSNYLLARSIFIVLIASALILGGALIGIYVWGQTDEGVIEEEVFSNPQPENFPVPDDTLLANNEQQQTESPELEEGILAPDEIVEPVTAVAAAVSPSVVRIDTYAGTGSGIILDASGRVVTNAHVVDGAQTVEIRLSDGTRAEGTVLGSDPNVDIAIVKIEGDVVFEEAVFALSDTVQVGQLAVAIGSPFGLEQSVTAGIVSAINRAVRHANVIDGSPTVVEMIQTDAPINPGNSGGALADRQGRVVGMNTSIRTDGIVSGNLGVGFAIPSDTILLVADRIVNGESLDVGYLGVSGQNPTLGRAGALIVDVLEGSPAWDGGLMSGDLVVSVDGSPILGMSELAAKIRIASPGTQVEIGVIRNGEEAFFKVILGTLGSN